MKTCTKCKETKELSEFHKQNATLNTYKAECAVCARKRKNEWRKKNAQKERQKWQEWYKDNKEKRDEYQKEYMSKHQKENSAYWNAANAKRRATKLKATPAWLTEEHKFMLEEIYDLRRLRTELTGVEHHVDHIVPLKGKTCCGLHVPWNLQVIPAYENLSKSNSISDSRRTLCHV